MAEPRRFDLESGLVDVGGSIAWPSTPDISSRVRARLVEPGAGRLPGRTGLGRWLDTLAPRGSVFARGRRSLVLAIVILLLIVGAVVAVGLGIPGLRIVFVQTLPTPTPSLTSPPPEASVAPTPASSEVGPSTRLTPGPGGALGDALGLGAIVPLGQVQAMSSLRVLVPTTRGLGQPIVRLDRTPDGPLVSLVYPPGPSLAVLPHSDVGLLVMEFGGALDDELATKLVGAGTTIEPVSVAGAHGLWIAGGPHELLYRRTDGTVVQQQTRIGTDTLVWERDGTLYRIESGLGRDATIALAESMR